MANKETAQAMSTDVIESLAETIGSTLERKRAAKQAVPDVYASGMRGNEEPPAVRAEKEAKARLAAKNAGMRRGVAPEKVLKTQRGRNVEEVDEDGKKVVSFKTSGKSKAQQIRDLQKQVADLQKKLGQKPRISIGG